MKRIMIAFVAAAITSPALADNSALFATCTEFTKQAFREYSIKNSDEAKLDTIYDKYCREDKTANTSNFGLGLDVVIYDIPIGLTVDTSNAHQAMTNFCKNYQRLTTSKSSEYIREERIVGRAYDSFDRCVAWASQGISIGHRVESLSRINFFLQPSYNRPVFIRGIKPSSNVKCQGIDPTAAKPEEVTFDGNTTIKLTPDLSLGMVCERTGKTDKDGNTILEEGEVTILTDIGPNGNYSIYMPSDTVPAQTTYKTIQQQIEETAKQKTKELEATVANLKAQINGQFARLANWDGADHGKDVILRRLYGVDGPVWAYKDENVSKGANEFCAAGGVIAGTNSYLEDRQMKTVYFCRYFPTLKID